MNSNKRKTYDPEFIKKAIKLALSSSRPISEPAKELGLRDSTLHTWISIVLTSEKQP
jgi:transposase-like protein